MLLEDARSDVFDTLSVRSYPSVPRVFLAFPFCSLSDFPTIRPSPKCATSLLTAHQLRSQRPPMSILSGSRRTIGAAIANVGQACCTSPRIYALQSLEHPIGPRCSSRRRTCSTEKASSFLPPRCLSSADYAIQPCLMR